MVRNFIFFLSLFFAIEAVSNEAPVLVEEVVQEVGRCENLLGEYPVIKIPMLKNAVRQTLYQYIGIEAIEGGTGLAQTLADYTEKYVEYLDSNKDGRPYPNNVMPDAVGVLSGKSRRVVKDFINSDLVMSEHEYGRFMDHTGIRDDSRAWAYWVCELVSAYSGIGEFAQIHKEVFDFVEHRPVEGEAGDFYVKIVSCSSRTNLGTRNRRSEPELWEGARFYIIDVEMQNIARESRRPGTGKLYIKNGGVDYSYDSPERVLLDGYNFGYGRIGPLVRARTKIAYIVPEDMTGEVFWNPSGSRERFWCGFIR